MFGKIDLLGSCAKWEQTLEGFEAICLSGKNDGPNGGGKLDLLFWIVG